METNHKFVFSKRHVGLIYGYYLCYFDFICLIFIYVHAKCIYVIVSINLTRINNTSTTITRPYERVSDWRGGGQKLRG